MLSKAGICTEMIIPAVGGQLVELQGRDLSFCLFVAHKLFQNSKTPDIFCICSAVLEQLLQFLLSSCTGKGRKAATSYHARRCTDRTNRGFSYTCLQQKQIFTGFRTRL